MGWNFDGANVTVEAGFGSGPFTTPASITWTDITSYVRNIPNLTRDGRTNEYDQFQPGNATIIVDNRARTFDATYGPAYTSFTAGAGAWSAGDLAAFSGATQLDVRFAMSLTDWTPAAVSMVASQLGTVGNYSWQVFIDSSGFLNLTTSNNGTATTTTNSGCRVSAADGQLICGRVTWTTTAGAVKFYIKRTTPDRARADCLSNSGWTQIGVTATGQTTALFNSTANVQVGDRADLPVLAPAGKVYYVDARTTIDSTTLRFAFWPKDAASAAATSWVASAGAGETWTKVGSPTLAIQGPYYGNLTPGTPLRVSCVYSATTYRLWYGYVRRFEQNGGDAGLDATVTISALTGLGWLMDKPAPDSITGLDVAYMAATGSTIASYVPFDEPLSSPEVFDSGRNVGISIRGQYTSGPNIPSSSNPVRLFSDLASSQARDVNTTLISMSGALARELSFWLYLPTSTSEIGLVFNASGGLTVGIRGVFLYSATQRYWAPPVLSGTKWELPYLAPGWHFVQIVGNSLDHTIYIDGGVVSGNEYTSSTADPTNYPAIYVSGGGNIGGAGVAELLAVSGTVTRSANQRATETSGSRFTWLLTAAGVPSGLQSVNTDASVFLGPAGYGGSYGQLCQAVNSAEQGRFYTAGDGTVTVKSKVSKYTATASTTSQATFGDLDTLSYSDITIDPASVDNVINSVTVSTPEGATATYKDTTSIGLYGERPFSLSNIPLASAGDALSLATYIVTLRAYPSTRVTGMSIQPRNKPTSLFPQVLGREIGDRITVNRRITQTLVGGSTTDNYLSAQVTIEGISHSIGSNGTWVTTYTTAPATPTAYEGGYFTADDAVLSVVDSGVVAAP